MSKWIGYAVSVNCGDPLGYYQGTILQADGTTITLTKAFRNGFPYPKSQVTLKLVISVTYVRQETCYILREELKFVGYVRSAADIKDLKIIKSKPELAEQAHSTVAVAKSSKKGHRATVCESLQANNNTGMHSHNTLNVKQHQIPAK